MTLDYQSGEGELFDLYADPGENVNLFHDPSGAEIKASLFKDLNTRPDDMRPNQTQVGLACGHPDTPATNKLFGQSTRLTAFTP